MPRFCKFNALIEGIEELKLNEGSWVHQRVRAVCEGYLATLPQEAAANAQRLLQQTCAALTQTLPSAQPVVIDHAAAFASFWGSAVQDELARSVAAADADISPVSQTRRRSRRTKGKADATAGQSIAARAVARATNAGLSNIAATAVAREAAGTRARLSAAARTRGASAGAAAGEGAGAGAHTGSKKRKRGE